MNVKHVTFVLVGVPALGTAAFLTACSNTGSATRITPYAVASGARTSLPQTAVDSGVVEFVYVTNEGTSGSSISAYQIDPKSGALAQIAGSPFESGGGPYRMAISPTGKFAYVANQGADDFSAYKINAITGALKPIAGSPFRSGEIPVGAAVDTTGKFAYVTNSFDNTVSGYQIDAKSGALRRMTGSPFGAGVSPTDMAVDPTGKFAYVADSGRALGLRIQVRVRL